MPAYAEITEHYVPSEASEGETLTFRGTIRNGGTEAGYCLIYMTDEFGNVFSQRYEWLEVGASFSETVYPTMPGEDYTTIIYAYYWDGSSWVPTDESRRTTSLIVVGRPYASITEHYVPGEAREGETLTFRGTIRNDGNAAGYCLIQMMDEFGTIFSERYEWLEVGDSFSETVYPTMPGEDYTTIIQSWHWE